LNAAVLRTHKLTLQKKLMAAERKKRIGIFVIAYNAVNNLTVTLDRIPQELWETSR
jgi:hypothetical protein